MEILIPPPKEYCELQTKIYKTEITLKDEWNNQIWPGIKKLLALLFGGFGSLKAIGLSLLGDIVSVAGSFASSIVGAFLADASAAVTIAVEMVLGALIQVFLAGPEAIFALVGMPLGRARDYCRDEAVSLQKAQNNLKTVMRILGKWLNGMGNDKYYKQMQAAIPFMTDAVDKLSNMISQLTPSGNAAPVFGKSSFNAILNDLNSAIQATLPSTGVAGQVNTDSMYRTAYNNSISKRMTSLNNSKNSRIADANAKRAEKMQNLPGKASAAGISFDIYNVRRTQAIGAIDTEWQAEIAQINNEYNLNVVKERFNAEADADKAVLSFTSNSILTKSVNSLNDAFEKDIGKLMNNLNDMLTNVKDAFESYKACQFFTQQTYNSMSLLQGLLSWFIEFGSSASNTAASVLVETSLSPSKNIIEKWRNTFQTDIDSNKNSILLAGDITVGNIMLKASSAMLNAAATKSMQEMINFQSQLTSEDNRFKAFQSDMDTIPDFNGRLGYWSSNALSLLDAGKYTSLLSDITTLLAGTPVRMASPLASDKSDLRKLATNVNNEFTAVLSHNSTVNSVLYSYSPISNPYAAQMKKVIDASGLEYLSYAIMALSVADLVNGIYQQNVTASAELLECEAAYPDLYNDPTQPDSKTLLAIQARSKLALLNLSTSEQRMFLTDVFGSQYNNMQALSLEFKSNGPVSDNAGLSPSQKVSEYTNKVYKQNIK